MLSATVTCSYAFMLPVATPPNAIVFAAAKMKPIEMVHKIYFGFLISFQLSQIHLQIKCGIVMNLVCVAVLCLMMATYGVAFFNMDNFPEWAVPPLTTSVPPVNCTI